MTDLKDRTALVTGSTSGIGKAGASALAARHARVLVVGRDTPTRAAIAALGDPLRVHSNPGAPADATRQELSSLARPTEDERKYQ